MLRILEFRWKSLNLLFQKVWEPFFLCTESLLHPICFSHSPPQEGSQGLRTREPVPTGGSEGEAGAWWTCFMAAWWISFNFEDFGYQWKPDSRAVWTWYEIFNFVMWRSTPRPHQCDTSTTWRVGCSGLSWEQVHVVCDLFNCCQLWIALLPSFIQSSHFKDWHFILDWCSFCFCHLGLWSLLI